MKKVFGRRILFISILAAFSLASPAHGQTPTLVHHVAGGNIGSSNTINTYTLPSADFAQAGNTFIVSVVMPSGKSANVADDKGDSFTKLLCGDDGSSNVCSYCASGITAGARVITVTPTSASSSISFVISEFNNTSCALDGSSQNSGSGSSIASGSFTTTSASDLIYQYTISDSENPSSWTPGAGFSKLSSQDQDGQYAQWQVQNSPGAINPTHSFTGTIGWNTLAFALKPTNSGSPIQAGIRVVRIQQNDFNNSTASYTIDAPCSGNLAVLAIPGANTTISSVTDTNGNSWHVDNSINGTTIAHADNAVCSLTMKVTIQFAAAVSQDIALFYDVKGAASPAYDAPCSKAVTGNQPGGPGTFDGTTITPSTSNGLIISTLGLDNNFIADMPGPPGGLYDAGNPLPFIPIDTAYQNNGWGHAFYTSTSPITVQWTTANGAGDIWDNVTSCYSGAAAGSQPTASATPGSVTFANTQVGVTSAVTNIQITNNSSNGDSLTINSFTVSSGNSGDFFVVAPTSGSPACNLSTATMVAAGSSCFVGVNFKPTAAGQRSSTLVFGDNTASAQGTVSLSGTGVSSGASSVAATAGTPQNAKINAAFATTLQATVKDGSGAGVSGASVTFTAPASGASGTFSGGTASATVTTDSNGIATAPTFAANSIVGSYVVNATVGGVGTPAAFSLTNTAGSAATIATSSGTPQSVPVNTAFATLQAVVTDSGGNAVSGVTVTFTAPASGASGTFPGTLSTVAAVTSASGVASAPIFTANATLGSYTVNATVTGVASSAAFSLTNLASAPASITATSGTPQSVAINAVFAALKATVKDSGGNGVSGAIVVFTAPATGASGNFTGGTVSASVSTDATGVATAPTFTANSTAGSYTVNAKANGLATLAAFSLTNLPGAPTIASLSPSNTTAGGPGFTLTVNGTNFAAASVVSFNGTAETTTLVSATQLSAAVTSADIANAGVVNVVVSTPGVGGGTSGNAAFTINNPRPLLSSLSPASASAGSAAFTLTVNGTGFINGATVSFNGVTKSTTFVSSTQVTAAITAADIATAGTVMVSVVNPAPSAGPSAPISFAIGGSQPTISSVTSSGKTHAPGGAALTLVVNGTNFVSNSVVNFGAKAETTTFVSSTQLSAAIPASDVTTSGNVSVSVTNPPPGGGTSSTSVVFTVDGFTMSGPGVPSTVQAGQQAGIALTLSPTANGFSNVASFSVSGLPSATTAAFSPSSVTPNNASVPVTLTVTTTATTAMAPRIEMPWTPRLIPGLMLWVSVLLAVICSMLLFRRTERVRRFATILPLALLLLTGVVLSGCAGLTGGTVSPKILGTPPGSSQLVIKATSGTMTQSVTVTLTVQ